MSGIWRHDETNSLGTGDETDARLDERHFQHKLEEAFYGGTARRRPQEEGYKPGTWFTVVDSTAKEGLPMPWKEIKIMDQREHVVLDYLTGAYPKGALCAVSGISHPTGDKWLARYQAQGVASLADWARRRTPSRTGRPRRWWRRF